MIDAIKEKVIGKGMQLMQSPAVTKLLESEQVGRVMEVAMSIPIKAAGLLQTQKERLVALLSLATQDDVDDLRRALSRMEDVLRDIRKDSGDLLQGVEDKGKGKPSVAE